MTFQDIRQIRIAVEESLVDKGSKDRGYTVDKITQDKINSQYHVTVTYLVAVKYDKELDPQIRKDPIETHGETTLIFNRDVTAREVLDKVCGMVEGVESREIEEI